MAALSTHLASTLPSLRPPARRLSPAASLVPPRGARIALRRSRHPYPLARNSGWFQNATRKKALLASETDSPNTKVSKQGSTGDTNSSPNGPPVLTILAGISSYSSCSCG